MTTGKDLDMTKTIARVVLTTLATMTCLIGAFAMIGCSSPGQQSGAQGSSGTEQISVYSREDGSGTRGAFIELFGLEEKDAQGNKTDTTTDKAAITNSTSVMMTSVANDPNGIGYISLGSLNDSVKAVQRRCPALPEGRRVRQGRDCGIVIGYAGDGEARRGL